MTRDKDKTYFQVEYESGTRVVWDKGVARKLAVVPKSVAAKFFEWADAVQRLGLPKVRRRTGFHDEPLKGNRQGQRSIRLNRSYRAIYVEKSDRAVELVEVVEVTMHEY